MKKLVTCLLSVGIVVAAIAAPPVRAVDTTPPNADWSEETLVTDTLSDLEWTLAFDELIAPGQVTSGEISNAGTAPDCSFTVGRRTTYPSGQTTFRVTVSGCSADGTIKPRLAQDSVKDAANNDGPVADVTASDNATYDTTAPVLTLVSVDTLTETTADLNFTSDESGTYYYLVYLETDSAPSPATIKAQGVAEAKGSAAATAATAEDVTMSGLTASTAYTVYLIVEDAAGNQSFGVSAIDFTTTATPDTTDPILSAVSVDTLTETTADLNFTSDESGTYYYLVYAAADSAPSAATIKLQGAAVANGSAAATAAAAEDVTMSGLTASTNYTVYLIVEDAAGNQSLVSDTDFLTSPDTSAPTAAWSAEATGAQTSLGGLSWTLTFNEAVTGLAGGDIENAATFTSTGCVFSVATADAGAGLVYTVTVASCSDGTIRPSLKLNSVTDAATNAGPAAAVDGSTTVTYTAPSGGGGGGGGGTPAPLNTVAPVVTGYSSPGASITSTYGTWNYANTYAYQWYRCTSASTVTEVTVPSTCTKITGATSASYVITALDSGSWLRVKVSATGSGGTTDILSASSAKVGPKPASIKARPPRVSNGLAAVGSTLAAKRGQWTNGPVTYAYQWYRCTKAGIKNPKSVPVACTAITGATAKTYTVKAADRGSFLRVRVTATGATGQGFRMSRTTGVIPN